MTDTGQLAPHQAALARMLGRSVPSPAQPIRDGWLTELRSNPSRALDGLQRTVAEHRGDAAQSQMLADLALKFSENHDRAEPEQIYRPCGSPGIRVNLARDGQPIHVTLGAETGKAHMERLCRAHREKLDGGRLQAVLAPGGGTGACDWPVRPAAWCDWCGATTDLAEDDELGTGNVPCSCHQMLTRPCRDGEACQQRRAERYPPDLSRVPSWVFEAQQRITDAGTRQMIMAATAAALGDFLELVAREDEDQLELAQQQDDYALRGVPAGSGGAYDVQGTWHPSVLNWSHINWLHTIGGHPANRSHLISGNHLSPARISAMAAVNQARGAQAAQEGGSAPQGSQGARREIPAEGLSPGQAEALHGGVGHDIAMQQPELPEASPQRPAQRPARDRYGNRRGRRAFPRRVLKYQGR